MFGPRKCAGIDKVRVLTEVIRLAGEPVEVEAASGGAVSEPQVAATSGLCYSFGNTG